ncbi:MAG: methyltransferase domain-containing protein [Terracidiphilus sp.]|jgi:ubiquinone/menaquinone biosynthesis C-methylase UbiE
MTTLKSQSTALGMTYVTPFDFIASSYDQIFTDSHIGVAQRFQVWRTIEHCFAPGAHVLELNCGTGQDALALARSGVRVSAYDAAPRMIEIASRKLADEALSSNVKFSVLRNEDLYMLKGTFDGALSNFGGLNCSMDWSSIAIELERLVKPDGHLLLCVLGRICLWEILYYFLRGSISKALRRIRTCPSLARVNGTSVKVIYPSIREIKQFFSRGFRLCDWRGVGVFVPPSYCEPLFRRRTKTLRLLVFLDSIFGHLPGTRCWGDHILLDFVRRSV